jgi:hypothetical protein
MVFLKLREDTIERIAKHDPEFAFAFLKDTKPITQLQDLAENEKAIELRLANIATANPDLAQSRPPVCGSRFSHQIILLRLLQRKARTRHRFFTEMVLKLRCRPRKRLERGLFCTSARLSFRPRAPDESTFRDLNNILFRPASPTAALARNPAMTI